MLGQANGLKMYMHPTIKDRKPSPETIFSIALALKQTFSPVIVLSNQTRPPAELCRTTLKADDKCSDKVNGD